MRYVYKQINARPVLLATIYLQIKLNVILFVLWGNIIVHSLKVVFLVNYIVEIAEIIILVTKDGVKLVQAHIT